MKFCYLTLVLALLAGCDSAAAPSPPANVSTIATGLAIPWGIAFLPDGTALVTERGLDELERPPAVPARILSIAKDGTQTEVMRLPTFHDIKADGVRARGESGLMGIAVSPNYATDKWIYVYYTYTRVTNDPQPGVTATDNRIARFQIGGRLQEILTGIPGGDYHDGGRIAFGPDGMLYATTGETYDTREIAQDRNSLGGKILRMTPEGKAPGGNPFPGSLVWSLGHRNVQGIAWDGSGNLYASELGADNYDEVNLIKPGANYGWPVLEGTGNDPRYTNPIATWTPTKAASPSGIAVLGNHIYVACLAGRRLYRIGLDGKDSRSLLTEEYGRLRAVTKAPDGSLWILTSNRDGRGRPVPTDDRILRFVP
jgi:glucose/arabinose dehydrogenase